MRDVRAAIEHLYRAFAAVPRPRHIDGCPCCIDRKEIGVLLSKPLRTVTPRELAAYAASAFLTVGEVADYRYFLPRILEVTSTDPGWWPSPEVTGRAIRESDPESWTAAQRAALIEYLAAVVDAAILGGEPAPLPRSGHTPCSPPGRLGSGCRPRPLTPNRSEGGGTGWPGRPGHCGSSSWSIGSSRPPTSAA